MGLVFEIYFIRTTVHDTLNIRGTFKGDERRKLRRES